MRRRHAAPDEIRIRPTNVERPGLDNRLLIDIHTHIVPREWPNLKERYGYGGFVHLEHNGPGCARMLLDGNCFRDVQSNCWDPAVRVAECDDAGVSVQVLSTVPVMFSYWAQPHHAADLSRLLNDNIAVVVDDRPDRFIGLGTVPLQDTDMAIRELDRCVTELGFPGVEIGSNVNGKNLDEPSLFPFFEAAEALGAAVFVHPWEMAGRERMTRYWLPWLVGMPAETCLAICSMIFGGVFERLPKLRVAFAHGGGSFPSTVGRIAHGFDVRPDLCQTSSTIRPTDYLGKFFLDSLVHDERALRALIDLVGADCIAMGSDYPFPLGEHVPGSLIASMDLAPDLRELLEHGSALRWLGLKKESLSLAYAG